MSSPIYKPSLYSICELIIQSSNIPYNQETINHTYSLANAFLFSAYSVSHYSHNSPVDYLQYVFSQNHCCLEKNHALLMENILKIINKVSLNTEKKFHQLFANQDFKELLKLQDEYHYSIQNSIIELKEKSKRVCNTCGKNNQIHITDDGLIKESLKAQIASTKVFCCADTCFNANLARNNKY